MFTPEEIEVHLARIESARLRRGMDAMDVHDPELDDCAVSAVEARRSHSGVLGVDRDVVTSLSEVSM